MPEKDFLQSVRDIARLSGWMAYHTYRSDRSEPGFPDLVLCRPPRVIFAELKNETGRVSDYQQFWLDNLKECEGVSVFLWRPSDWDSIVNELRRQVQRHSATDTNREGNNVTAELEWRS